MTTETATIAPFSAFAGATLLASGPLAEVAIAVKIAGGGMTDPIIIFDNTTGKPRDVDLRGSHREIVARLQPPAAEQPDAPMEPRGRGRPKLGVVAREITLLPRHWDWLATQPGGASVALRKLVEEARRTHGDRDRARAARDAAYHFISTMAGDLPDFEEASRALFSDDRRKCVELIAPWPIDIRNHFMALAFGDHG